MLHFYFGDFTSSVKVHNNQSLYIERYRRQIFSVDISDIQCVYIRYPSISMRTLEYGDLFDEGFVYVSLDGDIEDNPLYHNQTFLYTRFHKRKIIKFVRQLQYLNDNIQVVQVKRYDNMHKDRAVNKNRTSSICPSCQSADVHYMGTQSKQFSVKKALIGGLLTGGIGAVAGFAGKKGPDQWQCSQCRNIFNTHPR